MPVRAGRRWYAPPDPDGGPPDERSLCGTLLVQAGLAAAGHRDERAAADLAALALAAALGLGPTVTAPFLSLASSATG